MTAESINAPTLLGRTAIVTGASGGIGRAVVDALITHGARVLAVDRDFPSDWSHGSSAEPGPALERLDLRSIESINHLVRRAAEQLGRIDILANMATSQERGAFLDLTIEAWDEVVNGGLRSLLFLSQAVAREMATTGGGAIINLASDAAFQPAPLHVTESAVGGAVVALSRTMAYELSRYHIRVNVVAPAHTISEEMREQLSHSDVSEITAQTGGRWLDPAQVAPAVVFLASNSASGMTGVCVNVTSGGFMPH